MTFTALAFGTPDGFEDVFSPTSLLGSARPTSNAEFNSLIRPISSSLTYHDFGYLLKAIEHELETPTTLWLVQRLAIAESRKKSTGEFLFFGAYRFAYSKNKQRAGFYGAGHWIDRRHPAPSAKSIVSQTLRCMNAIHDHCRYPVFGSSSKNDPGFLFSSGIRDREEELIEVMSGFRYDTKNSILAGEKTQFKAGLKCYMTSDGEQLRVADEIAFAEKLLELATSNPFLLAQETIYASLNETITGIVRNWKDNTNILSPSFRDLAVHLPSTLPSQKPKAASTKPLLIESKKIGLGIDEGPSIPMVTGLGSADAESIEPGEISAPDAGEIRHAIIQRDMAAMHARIDRLVARVEFLETAGGAGERSEAETAHLTNSVSTQDKMELNLRTPSASAQPTPNGTLGFFELVKQFFTRR